MAEPIKLARPPLREALINLQLSEQLPVSFADSLGSRALPNYENVQEIRFSQFSFQLPKEKPAQASVTTDELMGRRFESKDKSRVVQFRRNGMTYSILRGYTTWKDLRAAASGSWKCYCDWAGKSTVDRVAVRYINVLELPLGGVDFDEYLSAGPRVPPELPQTVKNYLHRVEIPFQSPTAIAIITQVLEPVSPTHVPVILDIDIQAPCAFDGDSLELWSLLDKLREVKNLIFFSSLTKRAVESYL